MFFCLKKYTYLFFRLKIVSLLLCLLAFTSCVDEVEHEDTPQGNFEALWQIIDEHYCFFDYKQHEYGLDWQQVYNIYKVRANDMISEQQLFEVLTRLATSI